jgi:hypothetical protein
MRGRLKSGVVLSTWLAVPFLTFALIPSRHFFDLRYVMMAFPAFFLVVANGIVWLADALASAASRRHESFSRRPVAAAMLVALLATLSALSVASYLQFRQTHYRCSEFPSQPQVLRMQGGFCGEYLLLNTLLERDRYLLNQH